MGTDFFYDDATPMKHENAQQFPLCQIQTFSGPDPLMAAIYAQNFGRLELAGIEDTSSDAEQSHARENMGFVVVYVDSDAEGSIAKRETSSNQGDDNGGSNNSPDNGGSDNNGGADENHTTEPIDDVDPPADMDDDDDVDGQSGSFLSVLFKIVIIGAILSLLPMGYRYYRRLRSPQQSHNQFELLDDDEGQQRLLGPHTI